MSAPAYDDLILGSGMAGLAAGALLAKAGRKVLVLEAHDTPGGYAHTFAVGAYRFCAQVHYIFGCGEGETVYNLLERLDLVDEVPFVRLDPEGFDHVVVGNERIRVPNGLAKFRDRMIRRYPEAREPLRRYFHEVAAIGDELALLPRKLTPWTAIKAAPRHLRLLRYLRWTLADLYDHVGMPPLLRALLAGQSGDYLLPPRDVSLLLHVALVTGYDKGAYYPRRHFGHFVDSIASAITNTPGCALKLGAEVDQIHVEAGKVTAVTTTAGERFSASRYLSNIDPRRTAQLAGERWFARDQQKLTYDYSVGTFTMYLGVRGLDLRDHGFGSHNVWHYPNADLDRQYDDQLVRHDVSNPWLFMSTPSLHSPEPGICPDGTQILELATSVDHARYARLRATDHRAYNREKKKLIDSVLDVVDARYVPGIRDHLALRVAGTPATNERFCGAPAGNAYGSALTPRNVGIGRGPYQTAVGNLWLANATAGFPSVAGAIGAGIKVYTMLTGDEV
jgi:all-trans-retinol 13,14-reductase